MSVSTEQVTVFQGIPTTQEQRQVLRDAGFVHVTGLQVYDHKGSPDYVIGEKVRQSELGSSGYNNGKFVVVTVGGEIWLAVLREGIPEHIRREFCPNGSGAFVPLSNGEEVSQKCLLERFADPSTGLLVR